MTPAMDFNTLANGLRKEYHDREIDTRDGIKIEFADGWVQIRKSNTEPVIRVYAEGRSNSEAESIAENIIDFVKKH